MSFKEHLMARGAQRCMAACAVESTLRTHSLNPTRSSLREKERGHSETASTNSDIVCISKTFASYNFRIFGYLPSRNILKIIRHLTWLAAYINLAIASISR